MKSNNILALLFSSIPFFVIAVVLQSLEHELRTTSSALSGLSEERQQLQDELQEQIKQRAKMEFNVKDMEQSVQDDQAAKVKMSKGRKGKGDSGRRCILLV